jgi:hypothetical protein
LIAGIIYVILYSMVGFLELTESEEDELKKLDAKEKRAEDARPKPPKKSDI